MSHAFLAALPDIGMADVLCFPDIRMLELWLERLCDRYEVEPDDRAGSAVPPAESYRQVHARR
ncbi:MAG: hypothetical protein ACK4TB_09365 [Gemmobacter sp.]